MIFNLGWVLNDETLPIIDKSKHPTKGENPLVYKGKTSVKKLESHLLNILSMLDLGASTLTQSPP
jgi:hypothetical protein